MLKRPKKRWKKNTACLVTCLIATGHHLCAGFPLLDFRAQTRLISWLALIRGHISKHSRVLTLHAGKNEMPLINLASSLMCWTVETNKMLIESVMQK